MTVPSSTPCSSTVTADSPTSHAVTSCPL
jgi:hypothetical protein